MPAWPRLAATRAMLRVCFFPPPQGGRREERAGADCTNDGNHPDRDERFSIVKTPDFAARVHCFARRYRFQAVYCAVYGDQTAMSRCCISASRHTKPLFSSKYRNSMSWTCLVFTSLRRTARINSSESPANILVHSPLLRWLARPLLPKGWTAGSFKTSGEVDAQRVALQTLGTRLAVLSIISFLCKSASAATSYFTRDDTNDPELQSILFLLTTLAVQAVPSAVTLLLLWRYFLGRVSDGSGSLMQSLLT